MGGEVTHLMTKPWWLFVLFQISDRSKTLKNEQRKRVGNKNRAWQHLLLSLSCCFVLAGLWLVLWNSWFFITWHHINPSCLWSFCLVWNPPPECVQNQTWNDHITSTAWNIRNVNIYRQQGWLSCQSLISIITG